MLLGCHISVIANEQDIMSFTTTVASSKLFCGSKSFSLFVECTLVSKGSTQYSYLTYASYLDFGLKTTDIKFRYLSFITVRCCDVVFPNGFFADFILSPRCQIQPFPIYIYLKCSLFNNIPILFF